MNTRSAINIIPDDPEQSTYRFIIVAAKRARQLQNGARSFLPSTSKKPTVTSMEEVRRGLVKYEDSARDGCDRTRRSRIKASEMKVVLGVGGGIAAYKAAELARALGERGCTVQVVMTDAAGNSSGRSRSPRSPAARSSPVCGRPGRLRRERSQSAIEHIRVAQENEMLVVAPATADLIASFAHGLADDFLTTLYLAFNGPVVLAPAMNTNMWQHPATQANVADTARARTRHRGAGEGLLACGIVGPGQAGRTGAHRRSGRAPASELRSPRPGRRNRPDHGRSDAGAARSGSLISNRSSGKMGYALAEAPRRAGRA